MSLRRVSRRNNNSNVFIPRLEVLEDRCLLSCTIVEDDGFLSVRGTTLANDIEIVDNGTGTAGNITVTCDADAPFTSTGAINHIRVLAGRGGDDVSYELTADSDADMKLVVYLGGGDDSFTADLNDRILEDGANLELIVLGRGGVDDISLQAENEDAVNIESGASLDVEFRGGAGEDGPINVSYEGILGGNLKVNAIGGRHDDTVAVDITLNDFDTGTPGTVDATVQGRRGADDLTLTVREDSPVDAYIINALIRGGRGADTCVHTANVSDRSCETDTVVV